MQVKEGDILICVSELPHYTNGSDYRVTFNDIAYVWLMDDASIYYGRRNFSQIGYTHPNMACWTEHFITKEQYIRNKKLEELISNID